MILWNALTGDKIQTFSGLDNYVFSVAFDRDGNRLVTASADKTARIWDLKGKELQKLVGHDLMVYHATFSPDGKQVLTGSLDRTMRLWDATTGKELLKLTGHPGPVNHVAFSPFGDRLLSGGGDVTKIWAPDPGSEVLTLEGTGIGFSSDDRRLLATSGNAWRIYERSPARPAKSR